LAVQRIVFPTRILCIFFSTVISGYYAVLQYDIKFVFSTPSVCWRCLSGGMADCGEFLETLDFPVLPGYTLFWSQLHARKNFPFKFNILQNYYWKTAT